MFKIRGLCPAHFFLPLLLSVMLARLGSAREMSVPVHRVLQALQLAQSVSFDSWRPYKNPNRLIQLGMNKGEIIAIAGQPDYSESYYRVGQGRRTWISDWYYVRTGVNAETTLLKFVEETLVSITITPTP